MNGGAQAFLIFAIIALFFAVVVAPVLARILDGRTLGPASLGTTRGGTTRGGSPAFESSGFTPLDFSSAHFEASPRRGVQRNAHGLAGAPHAASKRGQDAWDLPDEFPEDPEELDRMIDIERVEGRLKSGAINKVMQLVDRHPQAAAAVLRGWIHRED